MGSKDVAAMLADIKQVIEEDENFNLSTWEEEFIANMHVMVNEDRELSEKQDDVLSKIWRRAKGY